VVPSENFLNIIIRNSEIVQVFEDSQILLASSSGFLGVSWLRNLWFDSGLDDFSEISISSLRFHEEILKIRKKRRIWILWFEEFRKIRIEYFINSNYSNYSPKFANSNNLIFWSTDQ